MQFSVLRIRFFAGIFFLSLLLSIHSTPGNAVPVLPNKAIVRGTIVDYCISTRPGPGEKGRPRIQYRILVRVTSVEKIKDSPSFLEGKEGQEIEIVSNVRLNPAYVGRAVKAVVEYRGDERGGRFWLHKVEIETY